MSDIQGVSSVQSEISLLDIVNFLQESWKKLVAASILGAMIGLTGWNFLSSYHADLVLLNNGGIDLVGLRSLQKSLPNLADQIISEGKVPEGQELLYRTLSEPDWWPKNLLATYGMSKADTKDLASTVGLESAGTSIVSLTISSGAPSKKQAVANALEAKNFFLQGASFLAIKSFLNAQEAEVLSADADIAKKISTTQVELGYQEERLKSLEALAKRFPNELRVGPQVIDPKDSGAKYLPISTQIIAANTDINVSKESLERLKDLQTQAVILRNWLKLVSPVMDSSFDGLVLIRKLLEYESQLRTTLDSKDPKSLAFVNSLRSNLVAINVRFTRGFEVNTAPTASKKGMLKSAAGGVFVGVLLMLMVLLGRKVLSNVKGAQAK